MTPVELVPMYKNDVMAAGVTPRPGSRMVCVMDGIATAG
jgi:hypothetical protein